MPRSFGDADVLQFNTGTKVLTSADINVTLGAPTTEGSCGIIVICCQSIVNPPSQWHIVAPGGFTAPGNPQAGVLVRADIPAGETT